MTQSYKYIKKINHWELWNDKYSLKVSKTALNKLIEKIMVKKKTHTHTHTQSVNATVLCGKF